MRTHKFISKSFIIQTGILDLSEDQIKRNIKKLAEKEELRLNNIRESIARNELHPMELYTKPAKVRKSKNKRGVLEWYINYAFINEIDRKRKVKKNQINKVKNRIERGKRHLTKFSLYEPINADYKIEISLNFKENYHISYYEEVAKELFVRYQKNMYFVTEKDSDGFYHLHIGSEGNKFEIMILMNHIVENVLGHFDDSYIKFLEDGNYQSDLHVSDIRSNDAYKKYLSKGDDGLGDAQIKFLNV